MTRTCLGCHGSGEREYERVIRTLSGRRIVSRDPLDAFLTALDDAGVLLPGDTDEDELLRVIAVELGRQLKAEREAEYQSRRTTAKVNREFPPDEPPTWLAEGTNR